LQNPNNFISAAKKPKQQESIADDVALKYASIDLS